MVLITILKPQKRVLKIIKRVKMKVYTDEDFIKSDLDLCPYFTTIVLIDLV
jgi:hypothetical protein